MDLLLPNGWPERASFPRVWCLGQQAWGLNLAWGSTWLVLILLLPASWCRAQSSRAPSSVAEVAAAELPTPAQLPLVTQPPAVTQPIGSNQGYYAPDVPPEPLPDIPPVTSLGEEVPALVGPDVEPMAESASPDPAEEGEPSPYRSLADFWGYRTSCNGLRWIVGDGDPFGMFSWHGNQYVAGGFDSGLGVGIQFHFLAGPERTDLPPRVFDFSFGYQKREQIGQLAYDVSVAVDAAADFEGSARQGIRFPCHAVGYLALWDEFQLVFGADYLDRGDMKILPVGGFLWRPRPDLRLELVFPTPRVDWQLTDEQRIYLRGGLGGGSWAVERDSRADDLFTYRDLQAGLGLERVPCTGTASALEITYLFARQIEYSSARGDYRPNGTVMLQWMTRY